MLVARNHRGMADVREQLAAGYLLRAAQRISASSGRVYILTGFPVGDSFETDGPAGAMALYRLCQHLGSDPVILSDAQVVEALRNDFNCLSLPNSRDDDASAGAAADMLYGTHPPELFISIERPGSAADGRCYNMAGHDITTRCGGAEPYLVKANCPTIAIGDGGNELGMGNVLDSLSKLNIQPAISTCDELVVADVSNWAAYTLCAVTRWLTDSAASTEHHIQEDLEYLVARGAIDGVTGDATPTEDGFPAEEGERLMQAVHNALTSGARA
jgi:hypothetical protein